MRFSSIFQLPLIQRADSRPAAPARVEEPAVPPAAAPAERELPDALDERVRLLGEWQLGEA